MRPAPLNPLFSTVDTLPGVGPKGARAFDQLLRTPARVVDLLFHLPHDTIDRRLRPKINEAPRDRIVMLDVNVAEHRPPARTKGPYKVLVEDDTGDVELVFFLANHRWIESSLPVGARRWVSGKIEFWDGHLQMVHPDRVLDQAALERLPPVEPVYALTDGLFPHTVAKAAGATLARLPTLPEWQDAAFVGQRHWPSFADALRALHRPEVPEAIAPASAARTRLAYDEMLSQQLALLMVRAHLRRPAGRASPATHAKRQALLAALPFALTADQQQALDEISADLASPARMVRLLQGDVGSGKTIVALLAAAQAAEAGRQAAIMAPTDILARQHFARMEPLAQTAGMRLALLTGRDTAAQRAHTLAELAAGTIDLVVGTHALFQESIVFCDLALAIVDEQHRFGVEQRLALGSKGAGVDILVMTATPIPRTLVMTAYGDMDVSVLREKPPGRQPIDTRTVALDRLGEVIAAVGRAIAAGAQVYWVCPLVQENAEIDAAAALDRYEALQGQFGDAVGLVHGQMKPLERDAAMARFVAGDTRLLVTTTVIEVGVDVPSATLMIIDHAERFGLTQMHQLRGRVGRGKARSSCLLLFKSPLGEMAASRLAILRETEDGFRIAEEDLRLRGGGEILGTRQSGQPLFRLAQLDVHAPLLDVARADAKLVLARDPTLTTERGEALRILLYLFDRDDAVRMLRAG